MMRLLSLIVLLLVKIFHRFYRVLRRAISLVIIIDLFNHFLILVDNNVPRYHRITTKHSVHFNGF